MYLIVGLGNPEEDYSKTRHNMGFNTINKIAKEYNIEVNKKKFDALYGEGFIENEKVILLKPQTYMNLSGKSIIQVVNFYKIPVENIFVIYDDIDVEPGNTPDNTTNTIQGQVQTSDDINMTPYVIMLGMSLLGILYVFKKRKSYRKII